MLKGARQECPATAADDDDADDAGCGGLRMRRAAAPPAGLLLLLLPAVHALLKTVESMVLCAIGVGDGVWVCEKVKTRYRVLSDDGESKSPWLHAIGTLLWLLGCYNPLKNHYAYMLNKTRHILPLVYTVHRVKAGPTHQRRLARFFPSHRCHASDRGSLASSLHALQMQPHAPITHAPHLATLPTHLHTYHTQALVYFSRL